MVSKFLKENVLTDLNTFLTNVPFTNIPYLSKKVTFSKNYFYMIVLGYLQCWATLLTVFLKFPGLLR